MPVGPATGLWHCNRFLFFPASFFPDETFDCKQWCGLMGRFSGAHPLPAFAHRGRCHAEAIKLFFRGIN
jgi:hypothetical protein